MLDVHPPHTPTHTWRDFLLHIVTIVVGLLIAIGLEQTVERLHHHYVLIETRENLHEELNDEAETIQSNLDIMRAEQKELATDAEILRGTSSTGGKLIYRWGFSAPRSIAWTIAKSNNTTALMTPDEVERYSYIFFLDEHATEIASRYIDEVNISKAIAARVPDASALTSTEREQLLQLTAQCQGHLTSMMDNDTYALNAIHKYITDLPG